MAELLIGIDPAPATVGARKIRTEIDGIAASAEAAERALDRLSEAAGARRSSDGGRVVTRSMEEVEAAARLAEQAIQRAGAAAGRFSQTGAGMAAGVRSVNDELTRQKSIVDAINKATGTAGKQGAFGRVDDIKAYGDELDRLRARFSPLAKISQDYRRTVDEARDAHRLGAISAAEMANAIQDAGLIANAQQRVLQRWREGLEDVADGSRLTGNQLLNLSRQGNDAVTMWMSGADAMAIFGTQIGQVVGALEEGPGGLRGSLSAIKNSVTGFLASLGSANLIAAGVTTGLLAAGGAAAYFMNRSVDAGKKAEKAQDAFNRALKETKSIYGDLAGAAERVMEQESFVSPIVAQQRLADAIKAQKDAREAAVKALKDVPGAAPNDYAQNLAAELGGILSGNEFDPIRKQIEAAIDAVISAGMPLADFQRQLSALKIDPELSEETYNWRSALLAAVDAAVQAENAIEGLQQAVVEANFATWTKALSDVRGEMAGFIPEATTAAEKIEQLYQRELAAIRNLGGDDRDMQARFRQAGESRSKALAELSRDAIQQARAAQDALSNLSLSDDDRALAEIRQRYDAEIAELDRLNGSEEAIAAKRREREAALGAASVEIQQRYADEAKAYQDAAQARIAGIDQTVAALREEAQYLGESEGASAAARFQFQALAAAKQAAAAAGKVVTPEEIAAIQAAAGEIGALTNQINRMREAQAQAERLGTFMADLDFDVSIARLPEVEQEIQRAYRDLGVTAESVDGQRIASNIRYLDSLEGTKDELINVRDLVEDAAGSIVDGFGNGKSAVDGFIDSLADIGRALARAGLNRIMDGIFGTGQAAPTANAIGAIGQAASSYAGRQVAFTGGGTYGFSMPQTYAAPVIPVQREVLPALGRMTDSLDAAAKAIRTIESGSAGGNYSAMGPVTRSGDRAYGAYQVMGANIPQWSKAALGRIVSNVEFLGSREIQDAVFSHRFGGYMQKYGAEGASRAWFAGEGGMRNFRAQDIVGTSVGGYGSRFGNLYAQHSGGSVDLAQAVEIGSIAATRKVAAGSVPGIDPWGGMRSVSAQAAGGASGQAGGGGFMQSPLFQGGMTALSAGAMGYQSGDPLGGAFSGAMAGLAMGNPIMAGVGAIAGLVGGIFGKRKQKKEAERQAKMQADAAWSQNYGSLLDFKDVVYRTPKGELSGQITELGRTLDEFAKLADATKDSGNKRHIEEIRAQLGRYTELLKDGFRDILDPVLTDLAAGRGLDTAFKKARDGVLAEAESYRGLIEDVKLAFQPDTSGRDAILADYKGQVASIEKQRRQAEMSARLDEATIVDGNRVDPSADLPAKMKAFGDNLVAAEIERDKAVKAWEAANADVQRRYDEAVAKAVTAAREGLLRVVSGDIVEQSDIEKAIAEAKGAAAGLDVALKDLGMSAEEAATAIEGALAKRMELLTETFTRGLQDQIDELDGKGYLAGFRDLIKQRDTLLKDASLINVDTSLVSTFFAKQAQALVDGADLSATAFDELIKLFPELSSVVRSFSEDLEALKERIAGYDDRRFAAMTDTSTLAGAIADFERRAARERKAERDAGGGGMLSLEAALAAEKVSMIQGLLIRARQDEVSEIESTISRLEGLRDEWKDLRASLKLDDTLSPLNQRDQALEAQRVFRENAAKASAGDVDAQAKQAQYAQSYLEEFKAYYASSEDYYAAFQEVQGVLETAETLADQQLKAAQSQLDVAKKQLDAMTGVKDSVTTLQEALTKALAELAAAMKTNAALTPGVVSGGQTVVGSGAGAYTTGNTATGSNTSIPTGGINGVSRQDFETWGFLGTQYQAILGRGIKDRSELDYYTNLRNQGWTADDIIAAIKASPEAKARGYAFGGLVSGPGTGTSDSIMARLSAGEFVMPARAVTPQTLPMLEGMRSGRMAGNDNAELIAEVRGLRAEVRSLRATVAEGELANVAATRAGVAAQQAAAVEQKKAASR